MVTAISQRDHTEAVVTTLEAAGLSVGRGVRAVNPDGSGDELAPPCAVVHPISGGSRYGTLDDHTKDADLLYQITCVGQTQEAAEMVLEDVEAAILGGIAVAGRLIDVIYVQSGSTPMQRIDAVGAPDLYFTSMPTYRLQSTPA